MSNTDLLCWLVRGYKFISLQLKPPLSAMGKIGQYDFPAESFFLP
ncbi:hypothetical protein HMPREF0281_00727 [Corynebacterium ammoniagenes DSM 20306]|uniref:Uncharacterized protein n=1 Tax=Corynebacterium ammoniagenes DSM 20306 TaxID=649754 RepID=A0ABN0AGI8_CORAM|nr:hypothetical protein HMPREF0281_00727 [Corynebacterium ammoniagenes DSM 20306]